MAEFRTKLSTAWQSFFNHLKQMQGMSGNGSSIALRKVAEGEASYASYAVPFLMVQLIEGKIADQVEVDKIWQSRIKLRVVTQVATTGGATAEVLSKIAQIEDKIDSYVKPDGVTGYIAAEWSITFSHSAEAGSLVIGECLRGFAVAVAKGAN